MATLTIEITDALKQSIDEVGLGLCADRDALAQSLLESAMRARWREQMESKIDEAMRDVERGDVHACTPEDMVRIGRQYLAEKRAREGRS